jgi:hypothetical protein
VYRLLVAANLVPSSPILVTLMMSEPSSSETSVLIKATWSNITEDGILHGSILSTISIYAQDASDGEPQQTKTTTRSNWRKIRKIKQQIS